MKKHELVIGLMFILAALSFFAYCSAKSRDASVSAMVNAFAEAGLPLLKGTVSSKDFSLPLVSPLATETTQSLSQLNGKVVFLNFWATWCGPCRAEMPSMEALYKRYREKGLEIIAVNCGENEPEVLAFMQANKLSFPAVLDIDGKVGGVYGIQAIPTTFLIDQEGKIRLRLVGSLDWDTPKIHAALEHLFLPN